MPPLLSPSPISPISPAMRGEVFRQLRELVEVAEDNGQLFWALNVSAVLYLGGGEKKNPQGRWRHPKFPEISWNIWHFIELDGAFFLAPFPCCGTLLVQLPPMFASNCSVEPWYCYFLGCWENMGNTLSNPDLRWENNLPPSNRIAPQTLLQCSNFHPAFHPQTIRQQEPANFQHNQTDKNPSTHPNQVKETTQTQIQKNDSFFFELVFFPLPNPMKIRSITTKWALFLGIFTSRNGSTKSLATMGEEALRRQLEQRLRPHGPSSWAEALAYEVTRHLGQQLGKLWEKWIKMGEKEEITGKNIFMNSDNKAIAVSLDEPNFRIHFLPAKNEGTIKHMASNQLWR